MNLTENKNNKLTLISFSLLLFYIFFGFIFSKTVFLNSIFGTIFYILLFVSFLIVIVTKFRIFFTSKLNPIFIIWFPYLIYTIVGCIFVQDYLVAIKWLICLFVVVISHTEKTETILLRKGIVAIGLICLFGIFFQIIFQNIYNRYIASLFVNSDQIINFGRGYGFSGFTYQLDTTAMPILYAEFVLIFSHDFFPKKNFTSKIIRYILILLLIVGVFLTGKRMHSLLSILIPIIVLLLSMKNDTKKSIIITLIPVVLLVFYLIFTNLLSSSMFENSLIFRRFYNTIYEYDSGTDFSSGRTQLAEMAVKAWRTSPIFGIGVFQYVNVTGAYTEVHNTYLQVLCEQGVFGLILFIIPLIFSAIFTLYRIRQVQNIYIKNHLKISFAIQLLYILYSFTGNTNVNMFGYMMYFISIGVVISSYRYYNYLPNNDFLLRNAAIN